MAITWRNVNAPNLNGASALFNTAQRSFNFGIDNLQNIVSGGLNREKQATAANSADFLNRLRTQYADPDQLRAAQQSGALDALRGEYASLDKNRTNALAVDSVVSSLQNRANSDARFAETKLKRDSVKHTDHIAKLIAENRFDEADQYLKEVDIYDEAGQTRAIDASRQSDFLFGQSQTDRARRLSLQDKNQLRADQQFERSEQERIRNEELNAVLTSSLRDSIADRSRFAAEEDQIEQGLLGANIDPARLDDPAYLQTLNRSQLDFIDQTQAAIAQIQPPRTSTEALDALTVNLLDSGQNALNVAKAKNAFDSLLTQNEQISTLAQQEFANEAAGLRAAFGGSASVQEAIENKPPAQLIAELRAEHTETLDEIWSFNKDEVETVFDAMQNGNFEFEGKPIKLPKALVSEALNRIEGRAGFIGDAKLTDVIKDMLSTGTWRKDIEDRIHFERGMADLAQRQRNFRGRPAGSLVGQVLQASPDDARKFLDATAAEEGRKAVERARDLYLNPPKTDELSKFIDSLK